MQTFKEGLCCGQDEDISSPARVDDLLEGPELEERLRTQGRLDSMLNDPELIPDWQTQFEQQQKASMQRA